MNIVQQIVQYITSTISLEMKIKIKIYCSPILNLNIIQIAKSKSRDYGWKFDNDINKMDG